MITPPIKIFLLLLALAISCSPRTEKGNDYLKSKIQQYLDSAVDENNPGILLHIESPERGLSWSASAGVSDRQSGSELKPNQLFRIASVTKIFVACTILRLYEEGSLSLNDPITKYISHKHDSILKVGGYESDQITIRHLLTHSSGLFDHTNADIYLSSILENPTHEWTRTEQLLIAIKYGKPVCAIGEKFSYSDTGYILLGKIIERVTHKSLNDAIQEQLEFKRIGLGDTFIENKGENTDDRIHQYLDGEDTYLFNPSIDLYGGGGLLSTTTDLAIFYQQLFTHNVFKNKSTLDTMLTKVIYKTKQNADYRIGVLLIDIDGLVAYTHTGYWGTQVIYIPKLNTSIAVNYSQHWIEKGPAPVLVKIISALNEYI